MEVDTRRLTLLLRDRGVTPGLIIPESLRAELPRLKKELLEAKYEQLDWVKKVSTPTVYEVKAQDFGGKARFQVVAYDYGIKAQLIRDLAFRGCDLTVVPCDYPAEKVLALKTGWRFFVKRPGGSEARDLRGRQHSSTTR